MRLYTLQVANAFFSGFQIKFQFCARKSHENTTCDFTRTHAHTHTHTLQDADAFFSGFQLEFPCYATPEAGTVVAALAFVVRRLRLRTGNLGSTPAVCVVALSKQGDDVR
jgi:hypothetical protein